MRISWRAALLLIFLPLRVAAHHAFAAEYNEKKPVVITGTVSGFEWINPHAWLHVDADNGQKWDFEMGSPGGLLSRGWKKGELKKGDRVTANGYAAKDGRNVANATVVTLPDGRKLFGGFQSTPGNPFGKK